MAEVFISYSKVERPLTADLARELEERGISVWWDTGLISGDDFRREIVRQIEQARAVIVIWSEASVQSDWVVSEATRARTQKKLVPVRHGTLPLADIPPPFDILHTTDLADRAQILAALDRFGIATSSPPPSPVPAPEPLPFPQIRESTDRAFKADVMDASAHAPILVEFWAPWAGPCRSLKVTLENVVRSRPDQVGLVRINVDEQSAISTQLGVDKVPAVFAFDLGRPVDAFMGNLPEKEVVKFVDKQIEGRRAKEAKPK